MQLLPYVGAGATISKRKLRKDRSPVVNVKTQVLRAKAANRLLSRRTSRCVRLPNKSTKLLSRNRKLLSVPWHLKWKVQHGSNINMNVLLHESKKVQHIESFLFQPKCVCLNHCVPMSVPNFDCSERHRWHPKRVSFSCEKGLCSGLSSDIANREGRPSTRRALPACDTFSASKRKHAGQESE